MAVTVAFLLESSRQVKIQYLKGHLGKRVYMCVCVCVCVCGLKRERGSIHYHSCITKAGITLFVHLKVKISVTSQVLTCRSRILVNFERTSRRCRTEGARKRMQISVRVFSHEAPSTVSF